MSYRIGIGYDIHRLVRGRKLFLGGVQIPYNMGLLGHSDSDVLLHAICDAILGAAAEVDIGENFPDTDPRYKDASSAELLRVISEKVRKKGFVIQNIDTVIIAEEPKFSPFKNKIKKKISAILKLDDGAVGVKAKTNEGLGDIGKKKAIAVYAVALLERGVKK